MIHSNDDPYNMSHLIQITLEVYMLYPLNVRVTQLEFDEPIFAKSIINLTRFLIQMRSKINKRNAYLDDL